MNGKYSVISYLVTAIDDLTFFSLSKKIWNQNICHILSLTMYIFQIQQSFGKIHNFINKTSN